MGQTEYLEPTPETRRKALGLIVAGIVVGTLLVFVLRPAFFAFIRQLPECGQARWLFGLLIASVCPLPFVALWAIAHARKLLRFNQSPLPDAWVLRRTPVRRGRPVRLQAYVLIACAAILFFAPLYAWHVMQPIVAALLHRCAA